MIHPLPPGTRDLYTRRIADIPEDRRTSWRYHVVRSGESLENIASTFHAHPADIEAANHLSSSDSIETGDELIIPAATATASLHTAVYVSRPGDTLVKIADRFNVTVEELRRWNHLSSNTVAPRKSLAVAEPVHLAHEAHVRGKSAKGGAARTSRTDAARPSARKKAFSASSNACQRKGCCFRLLAFALR